jgi:hypothetical protein
MEQTCAPFFTYDVGDYEGLATAGIGFLAVFARWTPTTPPASSSDKSGLWEATSNEALSKFRSVEG